MRWPWTGLEERVAALEARADVHVKALADLNRAELERNHRHDYRYTKTKTGTPDSFGGVMWTWSWKCDNEGCTHPSGGTNHRGGLPDHFPEDLR